MCKELFRHKFIRLNSCLDIIYMNTDRHPHKHVLRSLYNLTVYFKQVRTLKGFKPEIIVVKIPVINNG